MAFFNCNLKKKSHKGHVLKISYTTNVLGSTLLGK